jgi:CHAT domain-containing protein/tetratricopeptide (TPR) repeat protein
MRTHALAGSCAAILFALAGCTPTQTDPRAVFTTDLAMEGPEVSVSRNLEAGAYLVEIREGDIDVRLVVDAPGIHSEAEDEVPRHGILHKVVSLRTAGELRVTARNSDHSSKKGRVQVRIAHWRRAIDAPQGELELGYEALASAGELATQRTPAASQQAVDKLYEAVTHFDAADAEAQRAQAQYTLANLLYLGRDEYAGAIRAADAAADAYRDTDDELGIQNSSTLRSAAQLELAKGMDPSKQRAEQSAMYDDAERRLQESARYFAENSQRIRAEYAVNMRGVRAIYVGDYEAAAKLFTQAVEMARANEDLREQAVSLGNLAWVHNRRGFMAQAAAEYEGLLPMLEREKQPYLYAVMLGNYGFCLIALGDFDRALALHNEALALYTAQGKETERAVALAALGGLHLRIGDTERALEILRAAAIAQERVGDGINLASTLRMAGVAASDLGRHDEALTFLRKSAQIDANPQSSARTRVLIAGELRAQGDMRGAAAELAGALESGNPWVNASALEERGLLYAAQGKSTAAISDLRAADREYRELGFEFNRIDTNSALSHLLLATHDVAGASSAADEAVSIASRIRVKSANPEWRARFLSARYAPYEARIAVDLAAGGDDPVWRAFRTSELVRARSLADQLAPGPGRADTDKTTDELRARLTSLQLRLETRVQKQGASDPGTVELRRAVEETRAQIDANRAAIVARESPLPESLVRVQQTLPASTAVLAYFVGDHQSHAWLLTRNTLRHEALPGLAELRKRIIAAIGNPNAGAASDLAMRRLSESLLGKLLDGDSASRMLVIPDGPLNGVPFAALRIGQSNAMLVDRYVLGYAPSLSLAMGGTAVPSTRHARVAIVSDPVYASDDRRLHLAMGTKGGTLRGPRESSRNNLTRLPYSAMEARAVLRALGGENTIVLDGFEATPASVLALPSRDLGVLHFATHAMARSDWPEQSALYLSEFAADGSSVTNSRVTVGEITRSGLHADVVVLSGCATGDGSELRGEGVLGLTYGFLANGSRAVIASLWPIEDASTARFMSEFYGAYRSNANPAEALRRAQLRTRDTIAPSVWSSFVVRANGFP